MNLKNKVIWPYFILIFTGCLPFFGFIFSDKTLYSSDQVGIVGAKWFFESISQGVFPLWFPHIMGGMPTVDALAGDTIYLPFILFGFFLPIHKLIGFLFIFHLILAGIFAYRLAKKFFQLSPLASLVLGIAYMLNTNQFTLINGGHTGKFYILSFLPLGLYFLLCALRDSPKWYHYVGLSLSVSIFLFTSHVQLTYFVLIGFFFIWLFDVGSSIIEKKWSNSLKLTARFWVPILCGVGLAFMVFYPPYQYNAEFSVRGKSDKQTMEHATSWSNHPEETISLLLPEYAGYNEGYWGRNPFKINSEYPGLTLWLLTILGIVLYRPKKMWTYITIGILAIIYSLGANTPFFELFFNFVPGVKSFRAPSMILFWLVTSLWILAAMMLQKVESSKIEDSISANRKLKILIASVGLFFGLLALSPATITDIFGSLFGSEQSPNYTKLSSHLQEISWGAARSLILSALVLLGFWALIKNKLQLKPWLWLVMVVTVIDLYSTNFKFIETFEPERLYPPNSLLKQLKEERKNEEFRIFSMPGTFQKNAELEYSLEVVNGFVDNELGFYREFRGLDYQRNPNFFLNLQQFQDGTVGGNQFLNLLNVKYLLYRNPQNQQQIGVALNRTYLPRYFMVWDWEQNPDSIILQKLVTNSYDAKSKVYISQDSKTPSQKFQIPDSTKLPPKIKEIKRTANQIILEVENSVAGILCVQENYFPHWQVSVNGQKSSILRTNFLFRGVELPSGKSVVEFKYHSPWIQKGFLVALLSAIILVISALVFHKFLR